MAIVFFTAVQKLRGDLSWSGEALLAVINNAEFALPPVAGWFARNFRAVNITTSEAPPQTGERLRLARTHFLITPR